MLGNLEQHLEPVVSRTKQGSQGLKLLGFWMSRTPKNGDGNTIFLAGFPTGNPRIVRQMENLKLGSSGRKPRNSHGNRNSEPGFSNGNPNLNRNFQPWKHCTYIYHTQLCISQCCSSLCLTQPLIYGLGCQNNIFCTNRLPVFCFVLHFTFNFLLFRHHFNRLLRCVR